MAQVLNRRPVHTNALAAHQATHQRHRTTYLAWCPYCQQDQLDAMPKAQVDGSRFTKDPHDPTMWQAEASTLQLRPGQWPQVLVASMPAHGTEPAMEEEFYRLDSSCSEQGEYVYVVYATRLRSAYLMVFND